MANCNNDLLVTALSMLDPRTLEQVLAIATGDVKIYDEYSLPKPNADAIIALIMKKDKRELEQISRIESVQPTSMCSQVSIRYAYRRYSWYKTEEDRDNKKNAQYYESSSYQVRGELGASDDFNTITVDMEEWLRYVKECE